MKLIFALGNPEPEFTHTRHNVGKDVLNQFVQKLFSNYNWEFKSKFQSDLIFTNKPTSPSIFSGIQNLFSSFSSSTFKKQSDEKLNNQLNTEINMHPPSKSNTSNTNQNVPPQTNDTPDAILAKPTCYMNEVGIPLQKIATFYKIQPQDILIIYDELDLVVGEYKLSQGKGSKIHNGVKSINSSLKNSNKIWHLRIGVRDEKIGQSVQKSGRDPKKYVLAKFPISDRKKIEKLTEESIISDLNTWLSKKD